jgi:hypothetical protein
MTSQLFTVKKITTLPDETTHITLGFVVHFHGHQNKVVPLMKPYVLVDRSNGAKFHKCTSWLIYDTRSHHLMCQVNNHHINNKNLVLLGHVEIDS